MNPDPSQLRQQQQQAEETAETALHQTGAQQHEFHSVDDMMRFDAEQTPVPETVTERLKESIAQEPSPRSWWQRLFGNK